MAKSMKSKSKAKAAARKKTSAKAKHAVAKSKAKPPKVAAKGKAITLKPAKPAQKDLHGVGKALPKGVLPAAGKVAQKMDKATLKKALLQERIAKAQLKAKADGK